MTRRPPGLDGELPAAGVAQPDDPPQNDLAFTGNGSVKEINRIDSTVSETGSLQLARSIGALRTRAPESKYS